MKFNNMLEELKNGKTFEDLCKENKLELVECSGNEVYFDSDCEELFYEIGVKIENFGVGYVVLSTSNGEVYELPYEEVPNRFDSDLDNELIFIMDHRKIYDVTELYR